MELENIVPVEVEKLAIEMKKKEAAKARNTRSNTGGGHEVEIPEPKEKYKYSLGVGRQYCNTSPRTCNGYFNEDAISRFYSLEDEVIADRASDRGKKVEEEFKQQKSKQQLKAPPPGINASRPGCFPENWARGVPTYASQRQGNPLIPPGLNDIPPGLTEDV